MARIFIAMNGKRINTLDELRENFNAAQMISFYRGGRLQKWLEEIGATEELENIQSFEEGYDDDTLLSMLMAVFELSDEQIAKATPAQPEPVVEEVLAQNAATADEKHTGETDKQSSAIEEESSFCTTNTGWQVCQIGAKDNNGEILATCTDIADAQLGVLDLISGHEQHYYLSRAFFFDGYFWAQVFVNKDDSIWAKSSDCIRWELDAQLNKLLKDLCFKIKRIKVSDKHVFMLGGELTKVFIAYSSQTGWICKGLDSGLEDIFEGNGCAGIIKSSNESRSDVPILVCSIESNPLVFSELCKYSNSSLIGNIGAYVFKNYLFVTSDEKSVFGNQFDIYSYFTPLEQHPENKRLLFQFVALDAQSHELHTVDLPKGITVNYQSKIYVFKDAMFIISEKMIYTTDGLKWKKCKIDADKILVVVDSGNGYLAIAEGEKEGTSILFKSDSGEIWEEVQDFCFSANSSRHETSQSAGLFDAISITRMEMSLTEGIGSLLEKKGIHDQEDVAVAGNNMLLIFNGSTSGKYILVNTTMI